MEPGGRGVAERIGILTDIHGDYATMRRVLATLEKQRIYKIQDLQ